MGWSVLRSFQTMTSVKCVDGRRAHDQNSIRGASRLAKDGS